MADNKWDNSSTDGLWSTDANWSLGTKPDGSDDVIFDATSDTACSIDEAASCLSLSMLTGYTSTVSNGANTVAVGTGGGDVDVGTLALGSGKWTVQGDWLLADVAATTRDAASIVELAGTAKTMMFNYNQRHQNIVVSGTYTTVATCYHGGTLDVTGSLTVNHPYTSGHTTLNGTKIDGTGRIYVSGNITLTAGTWSVAGTKLLGGTNTLSPGTYTTNMTWRKNWSGAKETKTLVAGTYTIEGNLSIENNHVTYDFEIDLETNSADLEVSGDLALVELAVGATVSFKNATGTGSVTLNGTTGYDDGGFDANLGDVIVDDASDLALEDNMTCDDLTVGKGCAVTGAFLATVGGDFVINGVNLNESTWNGPDLNVTGTAVAHYTTATDSDASAGTAVTATDNCTDGTGNTDWNFGGVVVAPTGTLYGPLCGPLAGVI